MAGGRFFLKTLILSDIHGNLAALEAAAAEPHDDVICLGDIVGYGPEPQACVEWVHDHSAITVPGNHDRAASDGSPARCRADFLVLADAVAAATQARLGRPARDFLGELPLWCFFSRGRTTYLTLHATPRNPLYAYLPANRYLWAVELIGVEANVLFVGHTHLQFALDVGPQRVINPGSVGQPKDGDPRAAYAVLEGGRITLKRVAYDIERTVDGLRRLSLRPEVFVPLSELLRTGRPDAMWGKEAGRAEAEGRRAHHDGFADRSEPHRAG